MGLLECPLLMDARCSWTYRLPPCHYDAPSRAAAMEATRGADLASCTAPFDVRPFLRLAGDEGGGGGGGGGGGATTACEAAADAPMAFPTAARVAAPPAGRSGEVPA